VCGVVCVCVCVGVCVCCRETAREDVTEKSIQLGLPRKLDQKDRIFGLMDWYALWDRWTWSG
jgi:hypothetical protein